MQKKEDRHLAALGAAIKSCREAIGLSQEEFAKQINASVAYVQRLEAGQEEPRIFALIACSKVFDISVDELLDLAKLGKDAALLCLESE